MNPIIALVAVALVLAFLIGYTAAETRERRAHAATRSALLRLQQQKRELGQWIREHWPNEFDAYRNGHIEGYQQGVSHAPELEERARLAQ